MKESLQALAEISLSTAVLAGVCGGAALFCEATVDVTIPWLLAGIRHLLRAYADTADIFGAGLGSLIQVELRGFIVAVDFIQVFLLLINLFTLGRVGAVALTEWASAALEGVSDEAQLAKLGFAMSEADEPPTRVAISKAIGLFRGDLARYLGMASSVFGFIDGGISLPTDAQDFYAAAVAYLG